MIKDIIKETFSKPVAILIALHLAVLSGILAIGPLESYPALKQMGDKLPILSISAWAILLYLMLLASYVILSLKYKDKFKPKFGILWDKNKEPYCPACKTLLSGYTEEPPDHFFFWCHHCKTNVFIYHGKGIPLSEAKKQI